MRSPRRRHLAARATTVVAVSALLVSACTDSTGSTVDATASPSSTPPGGPASPAATPEPPLATTESTPASPATAIDLQDGRHAVYLGGIDGDGQQLTVDVIQWLTGEDAATAYHDDHPDDPEGPPNDYYIVNDNPRLRDLPVADDVTVRLVRLQEDGDADLDPGTWDELPAYLADYATDDGRLSYNPFWVTIDGQLVVGIEEQYIP